MNRGIDCATGDWIYFLGADDVLCTDAIFSELYEEGYLEKDGLVYGNVFVVGEGSWTGNGTVYDGEFDLQKLFHKNICHQAILYPAHLVRRIGYFKHKYFVTSDWEYNVRCAACAELIYVEKVIAKFASGGISSSGRNDGFGKGAGGRVQDSLHATGRASLLHQVDLHGVQQGRDLSGCAAARGRSNALLPEFLFTGFAPLMQTSPTHGNALFVHRHYAYAMEKEPPEPALPGTEWPVTGDNRPTRNAPCPCGSGKRYRSCHGSLS